MISLQKGLGIGLFILAGEVFCSNLCRCNLYSTSTYYYIAVAGFQRQSLLPDSSSSSVCSFGRSSSGSGTCMCLWCRIFVYSIKKVEPRPPSSTTTAVKKSARSPALGIRPSNYEVVAVRPALHSSQGGSSSSWRCPPPTTTSTAVLTAQAADSMKKRALVVSRLLCCT